MGVGAVGGGGGYYPYAPGAMAAAPAPAPAGDGIVGVMKDAVELENAMALKLLAASEQNAEVVRDMELTQQIVDMYV